MARFLPVICFLLFLAVSLFAEVPAKPLPRLTCAVGEEVQEREELDSRFQFCATRAVPCPISENVERQEVEVEGRKLCRIASGPARFLNTDGSRVEMTYAKGLLQGLSITYSPSGKKVLEEGYHHGIKAGVRIVSDQATGKKLLEEHYRDGQREGLAQVWYPGGTPKSSVNYKLGKRDGKYQEWYPNGKKRLNALYKDGKWQGQYAEFYSSGSKRLEAHLNQGMYEGDFRLWYPSGKRLSERSYTKGILNGLFKEWDGAGTMLSKSRYVNGKLEKFEILVPIPGMRRLAEASGEAVLNPNCADVQKLSALPKGQILFADSEPKCIRADLDSNGYADYIFSPASGFTISPVVFMRAGEMIQKLEIEDANLALYPINPFEGDFGEPVAFHEGLVSRGSVTKVYLYDFDTRQFTVSHHAAE